MAFMARKQREPYPAAQTVDVNPLQSTRDRQNSDSDPEQSDLSLSYLERAAFYSLK